MLNATMRGVRAWEQLHDPDYCGGLTACQLYDLVLRAGYGEAAAQEAANDRGLARLAAGVRM